MSDAGEGLVDAMRASRNRSKHVSRNGSRRAGQRAQGSGAAPTDRVVAARPGSARAAAPNCGTSVRREQLALAIAELDRRLAESD